MNALKQLVRGLSVACLVVGASACGGTGGGAEAAGPTPTAPSASKRIGFIGLPPEGATPSTPASGKVVISYVGDAPAKIIWTTRTWGRSLAWVYADGRLIWVREDDRPYGANHISTGLLEQRLTPEGVELLRTKVISTGVLEHNQPSVGEPDGHSTIQVREGGRLLGVGRWSPRIDRKLAALFTDPASWLPASAWEHREIRAYVPSRYAVCYGSSPEPIERSRVLTLLPAAAEDLLRIKDAVARRNDYCSDMTTEEARALAEALDDAGIERSGGAQGLGYRLAAPSPNTASISFAPYLPHGEAVSCTVCG